MDKKKLKIAYAAPRAEVFSVAESPRLLYTSFYGGNGDGTDESRDGDHFGGNDGGIEYGAKSIVILGWEFVLESPWE
ncbi:MAG: hypothetical protein IKZ83_03015 [Prevotella sp.]|nr:hypothetical protein [Prevotella sp.]